MQHHSGYQTPLLPMISPIFLPVPLREIVLTTTLAITANAFLKSAEAQILEYLTVELVETP